MHLPPRQVGMNEIDRICKQLILQTMDACQARLCGLPATREEKEAQEAGARWIAACEVVVHSVVQMNLPRQRPRTTTGEQGSTHDPDAAIVHFVSDTPVSR